MEKIVITKITTGEFIIGKLDEKTKDILEPFIIDIIFDAPDNLKVPSPNVRVGINFRPFFFPFQFKAERVFKNSYIAQPVEAPEEFKTKYLELKSGLIIANTLPNNKILKN